MIDERRGQPLVVAVAGDAVVVLRPEGCPPADVMAVARLVLDDAHLAALERHLTCAPEVSDDLRVRPAVPRPVRG